MRGSLFVGFALSLAIATPALAEGVYKWTDAQGKVHYGDVPPAAEQNAKGVNLNVTDGVSSPRSNSRNSSRTRSVSSGSADEFGPSGSFCRDLAKYASLQDLRDKGCRIEQGSCTTMRDYLEETRAATGRESSAMAKELGERMQREIQQRMQAKGC